MKPITDKWLLIRILGVVIYVAGISTVQSADFVQTKNNLSQGDTFVQYTTDDLQIAPDDIGQEIGPLKTYTDKNFGMRFQYPENWKINHSRGQTSNYEKISIRGKRNVDETYNNSFVIVRQPDGSAQKIREIINNKISQILKLPEAKIVADQAIKLFDTDAHELSFTYPLKLPLRSTKGKKTDLHENRYYYLRDGFLYQFIFYADARDYDSLKEVFDQFIQSIKWE